MPFAPFNKCVSSSRHERSPFSTIRRQPTNAIRRGPQPRDNSAAAPDRLFSDYLYFKPQRDDEKGPEEFHRLSHIAVELWRNCTRVRAEHDCATDRRLTSQLEASAGRRHTPDPGH